MINNRIRPNTVISAPPKIRRAPYIKDVYRFSNMGKKGG
jgi:hypothetical protein